MAEHEYRIRSVPPTDLYAALRCEADRAEREGFGRTAERQRALALHLENAVLTLASLAGDDTRLRVQVDIAVHLVPNVNPVLRPEYRAVAP
jgi:aspartate aminotransferase-like enzyme